jgi:6-pyruvoyl-tetrahydropterin synthase
MSTISVKMHFAAGHRILGLEGLGEKCRNIHGHTFQVTWVLDQDPDIEFGKLKAVLRQVTGAFDHAFLLDKSDDFLHYLRANMLRHYALPCPPTTECIAAELARLAIDRLTQPQEGSGFGKREVTPALYPHALLRQVIVEEGPENCATWEANEHQLGHLHMAFEAPPNVALTGAEV